MPIEIPDDLNTKEVVKMPFTNLLGEVEIPDELIEEYKAREEAGEFRFETVPFDARFPDMNQTKNCWQNYADFQRCIKAKGEEYLPCQYFKKIYTELCPDFWLERWDAAVAKGVFNVPPEEVRKQRQQQQ